MPDDRSPQKDIDVHLADAFDPFKSPSRLMVAMAKIALPVLLERAGGFATWTDDG